MPDAPVYEYNTPFGKIKIQCRKDDNFFYCNVDSLVYKNEIKLEKAKLTAQIQSFLEWLK